jgi:5,10-methylenetetrahydromethanopterin reductase
VDDREVVEQAGATYDERNHGLSTATHAALLPDEFLDRFAVVGPPAERCTDRLRELLGLGLGRIVAVPGSRDAVPQALAESNTHFASEVLRALRGKDGMRHERLPSVSFKNAL